MSLFDPNLEGGTDGYRHLLEAEAGTTASHLRSGLEGLWREFEPFADDNFRQEFARQPEQRFWEMYLGMIFRRCHKNLRRREELQGTARNTGPDFCIHKGNRNIWVEAITPGRGNQLDRVPDLFEAGLQDVPMREIQLRITHALKTKAANFARYRESKIIGEKDSCIVAISTGEFGLGTASNNEIVMTALYPMGEETVTVDRATGHFLSRGYQYSAEIKRAGKNREAIPRTFFITEEYADISGLIWSRRSSGNFQGQGHDLVYVHNREARRPIPRHWIDWEEEFYPINNGTALKSKRYIRRFRF